MKGDGRSERVPLPPERNLRFLVGLALNRISLVRLKIMAISLTWSKPMIGLMLAVLLFVSNLEKVSLTGLGDVGTGHKICHC